jgi:hypothetical protein
MTEVVSENDFPNNGRRNSKREEPRKGTREDGGKLGVFVGWVLCVCYAQNVAGPPASQRNPTNGGKTEK